MKLFRILIIITMTVVPLLVASCGSDEPEGVESYYLDIQSQVALNLHDDDDNNQGTMSDDGKNDVLSHTVLLMKQSLQKVTSEKNSRQANDAAVIRVCDSIYNAYVKAYGNMERIIVCQVKVYRTKTVNGVQQYNHALKTYHLWLVEVEPDPTPTEKIEKPDCLEQVDLGLSVMWANCNLGAKSPEGYGGHYAWGDPTGKLWSGNGIRPNLETLIYSWNSDDYGGNEPPANISGSSLDIITANWGDGWRMPTYSEAKELCEKCQWKLRMYGDAKRYEVIGPNGNSIIIPLAGMYGDDLSNRFHAGPRGTNEMGCYWTSTICQNPILEPYSIRTYGIQSSVKTAWMFYCDSSQGDLTDADRFVDYLRAFHMSIRAVHDK